jgi:hypothetical protein
MEGDGRIKEVMQNVSQEIDCNLLTIHDRVCVCVFWATEVCGTRICSQPALNKMASDRFKFMHEHF